MGNLIDSGHYIRGELLDQIERSEVFLQLFHARGSEDDGADVRVLETPCHRESRQRGAEFAGDIRQRGDRGELPWAIRLIQQAIAQLGEVGRVQTGVLGYALTIFTGKQAGGHGRPGGQADFDRRQEERGVFLFDPRAME